MKKDQPGPGVEYFDTMMFPGHFGVVWNAKAWDAEMRRLKVEDPQPWHEHHGARTVILERDGVSLRLVQFDVAMARRVSAAGKHCTLTHEAVHVWQDICEGIGEEKPGVEIEAYAIQYLTECLVGALAREQKRVHGRRAK